MWNMMLNIDGKTWEEPNGFSCNFYYIILIEKHGHSDLLELIYIPVVQYQADVGINW